MYHSNRFIYHHNDQMTNPIKSDTDTEFARKQIELMRQAPAWRKLELVAQMNETIQILALTGLRQRHPDASKQELDRRLADQILGANLAARVYGPINEDRE